MRLKQYKYYIGIGCGVQTGLSVYSKTDRKLTTVCCMTIVKALDHVRQIEMNNPGEVFVRIEDARLRKWIPKAPTESRERGRREGAGSVKRDAKIWEEFLLEYKIPHEFVAPKNNKTKVASGYFRKLTGWAAVTNQHGRDAAMLVFGF